MKKVLLHIHLDGSVRTSTASELLNKSIDDVKKMMQVDKNNANLTEYLKKFDLPISLMQSEENLTRIAYELAVDLKKDDVIYAEVRFAPIFHTKEGLTLEQVVEAILKGFRKCDIKINLLLCMMRGQSNEDNYKIIDLASKYLGKGVCGLDLAGDEFNYKTSLYKDLFMEAKSRGIPFTIHAGEADGVESIMDAISYGATRIGHGIRCIESNEVMSLIKDKNILLEICPTSNIQTRVVDNYSTHPVRYLFDNNIRVCFNTDNNTVSGISLEDEYNNVIKYLFFTEEELVKSNIYAIENSFLSDMEKEELKKLI